MSMVSKNTYICKASLFGKVYRITRQMAILLVVVVPTLACAAIFGYGLAELLGLPGPAAVVITVATGVVGGGAYLRNLCIMASTEE